MEGNSRRVCPKEIFKCHISIALKGCNYKSCLSTHCPNCICKNDGAGLSFQAIEKKLIHYLRLYKQGSLDISCDDYENVQCLAYPSFRELLNFKFAEVINCTYEEADLKCQRLQVLVENLDKVITKDRKIIVAALADYLAPQFYSIQNLSQRALPMNIVRAILQFGTLFYFLIDIEGFYEFPKVRTFFSSLNFTLLNPAELQKSLADPPFSMPFFDKFIENVQNTLTVNILESQSNGEDDAYFKTNKELCDILKFFHLANGFISPQAQISPKLFINESIMSETDIKKSLLMLLKGMLPRRLEAQLNSMRNSNAYNRGFNFLHYSFLFHTVDKIDILKLESYLLQDSEIENFLLAEPLNFNFFLLRNEIFLELVLRRDNLLEDSLNQLALDSNTSRLKRPLKVRFVGEPGVDEGGLTKEFFQLLTAQLFAPSFGMFEEKNSRYLWFDARSFECSINFSLAGVLLGVAFYNQVMMELPFSLALYKKLILYEGSDDMCNQLCLQDLLELEPEIYYFIINTLKEDMDNPDHGLTFVVEKDFYGEVKTYEFIPNGAKVSVTNGNKSLFVDSYLAWYFNISIEEQFKPFAKGFFSVISGKVFKMFNAQEFFAALNGSDNLDFSELKRSTQYDQGYTQDSPTIKHFWETVEDFNEGKKRTFLKFLTASPRAPLRGLGEIKMTISRNGDDVQRIPSAHTCFNHLLLPDYNCAEVLRQKLLQALDHSEGFGLI